MAFDRHVCEATLKPSPGHIQPPVSPPSICPRRWRLCCTPVPSLSLHKLLNFSELSCTVKPRANNRVKPPCNPALERFTENCSISSDLWCSGCLHEFHGIDYEFDPPAVTYLNGCLSNLFSPFRVEMLDIGCKTEPVWGKAWHGRASALTCSTDHLSARPGKHRGEVAELLF